MKRSAIKTLKSSINSCEEYRPLKSDRGWKKKDGIIYMPGEGKYRITNDLLNKSVFLNKILSKFRNVTLGELIKRDSAHISLIYKIDTQENGVLYVGSTSLPLLTFIKVNLLKLLADDDNVFDNVEHINKTDLQFHIIEWVDSEDRDDVITRRRFWRRKLIKKEHKIEDAIDVMDGGKKKEEEYNEKLWEKRIDIINKQFEDFSENFKEFTGTIIKLYNKEELRTLIVGFEDNFTRESLFEKLSNSNNNRLKEDIIKYGTGTEIFDVELLETFVAKSPIHFSLRIDWFRLKYNSIGDNGYNNKLLIPESKQMFEININTRKRRIAERSIIARMQIWIVADECYKNIYGNPQGYFIFSLTNNRDNNKVYYGYSNGDSLCEILIEFYNKVIAGNVKHNNIVKAMGKYPWKSWTLRINPDIPSSLTEASRLVENLINQYDTRNPENGYNIDYGKVKQKIVIGKIIKKS